MKRVAATLVVVLLIAVLFSGCLGTNSIQGFSSTDLKKPTFVYVNDTKPQLPSPITTVTSQFSGYTIKYAVTEAYASYGGVLLLQIQNDMSSQIYVYGYGLRWISSGESYFSNSSVYIEAGQTKDIGLLAFGAPSNPGPHQYSIIIKVAAKNPITQTWRDYGESSSVTRYMTVLAETWNKNYTISVNDRGYYNAVNSRVNFNLVGSIVSSVQTKEPGQYNMLQIAEAYEWVRENIQYKEDENGDYWQSVQETLSLLTGDCEDQAILMVSIITALGGTARVDLIEQHAFPTVFIGSTDADLEAASNAIQSFYGTQGDRLHISYLHDDLGYWMVIDTAGFPYAGGLPALSAPYPSSNSNSWTFESSNYLITIDVTGQEASNSIFAF